MDRWSRREFMQGAGAAGLGLVAGCGSLPQPAQRAARMPRIGYLEVAPNPVEAAWDEAFRQGLQEQGYVEGQNITVEWRAAPSREHLPEMAAELVRLPVELIVVRGDAVARA